MLLLGPADYSDLNLKLRLSEETDHRGEQMVVAIAARLSPPCRGSAALLVCVQQRQQHHDASTPSTAVLPSCTISNSAITRSRLRLHAATTMCAAAQLQPHNKSANNPVAGVFDQGFCLEIHGS